MVPALLAVGVGVAVFVSYNIGGSSTGVAFGPAVGSRITSKTLADATGSAIEGEGRPDFSVNALAADGGDSGGPQAAPTVGDLATAEATAEPSSADAVGEQVPEIGEEEPEGLPTDDLFDAAATGRIVMMWLLTPTVSAIGSYLVFALFF